MANTIQDAMAAAGLPPDKSLDFCADGRLFRFRVTGDKSGCVNGWAVLHGGLAPLGALGIWKTRESQTWRVATCKPPTPAKQAWIQQRTRAMQQAHAQEREAVQAEVRVKAQWLWSRGKHAINDHLYRSLLPHWSIRPLDSLDDKVAQIAGNLHKQARV